MLNVFDIPPVVAINRFPFDNDEEMAWIKDKCESLGVTAAESEVFMKGGEGGLTCLSLRTITIIHSTAHLLRLKNIYMKHFVEVGLL